MDRRKFLTYSTSLLIPNICLAYSDKDNEAYYSKYRRTYTYEPERFNQQENSILPFRQKEQEEFWTKPRRLFLKREQTGEEYELYYYRNNKVNEKDYWIASYLLRDVRDKKMVYIDLKLLDLLCAVQAWLLFYKINQPIHVLSGFRTENTNSKLEGAAKNSMHLQGKAVDFMLPNIKASNLAIIARQFQAGGIGLYPSNNFLHLDTGNIRTWIK